jgi:hypothetical protein
LEGDTSAIICKGVLKVVKLSRFLTTVKSFFTPLKCGFRRDFFEKKFEVLPKSVEYVLISEKDGSLTAGDELMVAVYMVGGIAIAS